MSARLPTMKCQFLVRMQVGAASALQATTTRLPRAQDSHLPSAARPRRSPNKRGSELRCKTDSGIFATAPLALGLRRRNSSSSEYSQEVCHITFCGRTVWVEHVLIPNRDTRV